MRKILLISVFLQAILPFVQSQTWIGISHNVGLNSIQLDYFNPNATIDANGLMLEYKFSKHYGVGFGLNRMRYNYNLSDIYFIYSRYPVSLKYYGRFLNFKPTLYFDFFHGTNATQPYYEVDSDLTYSRIGFGVSLSKDFHLSEKLLLEPEITYLSTRLIEFLPELTFGINLKYKLK